MEVITHSSQNVIILEIAGRIDSHTVPKLRDQLTKSVAIRPANIVIDLKGVNFIDSSGLAAIVQGMRSCRDGGGNLYLSNPQRPVRLILELTRLDGAIDIFPNDTAAIASFQKHG